MKISKCGDKLSGAHSALRVRPLQLEPNSVAHVEQTGVHVAIGQRLVVDVFGQVFGHAQTPFLYERNGHVQFAARDQRRIAELQGEPKLVDGYASGDTGLSDLRRNRQVVSGFMLTRMKTMIANLLTHWSIESPSAE